MRYFQELPLRINQYVLMHPVSQFFKGINLEVRINSQKNRIYCPKFLAIWQILQFQYAYSTTSIL